MSAILRVRQNSAAPVPVVANFTEATGVLGAAIRMMNAGVDVGPIPSALEQAAWRHLHAIEPLCGGSKEDAMLAWLDLLVPHVVNAPGTEAEITASIRAIWEVCEMLPIGVWCHRTRLGWVRTQPAGRFWPRSGELFAHLSACARSLWLDRDGCAAILEAARRMESQAIPTEPSAQEREAVGIMLQAYRGEQAEQHRVAKAIADRKARLPPFRSVTDLELLALHEHHAASGDRLAQVRVDGLRAKLGLTDEPEPT